MKKNPILAVVLSTLVFPGVGQIYNRQYKKGLAIAVVSGILLFFMFRPMVSSYISFVKTSSDIGAVDISKMNVPVMPTPDASLTLFLTIVWLFAIVDAYVSAKKNNNRLKILKDGIAGVESVKKPD